MESHHRSGRVIPVAQYGTISISDCKAAAWSYPKLDKDGEHVINKHSTQLLACIQASISDACALKVVIIGETYEIEVNYGDQREIVQDRQLYLRILISRLTIDSRSTVSYI